MANKIITKPNELVENVKVLYTGNHFISVPIIDCETGGVKNFNVMSGFNKALVEVEGKQNLLCPEFYKENTKLHIKKVEAEKEFFYYPKLTFFLDDDIQVEAKIYTDLYEKGLIYKFKSSEPIEIILNCDINQLNLLRFNSHPIETKTKLFIDKWLSNPVVDCITPKVSLSMAFGADSDFSFEDESRSNLIKLKVKCAKQNAFYMAINSDPDGASTTLIHLRRKGYQKIFEELKDWFSDRIIRYNEDKHLEKVMNENLFFNYFFAVGKDMETDQYLALTSRSPRYYVSGAFWERDSFLWSFPAIKLVNPKLHQIIARDMMIMHSKNPGDHAHYIDGTVLYPGFELDEAASYFILLGDMCLEDIDEQLFRALLRVWECIKERYDDKTGLYSTFLLPSDDPADYPFVTINNVILLRGLKNFVKLLKAKDRLKDAENVAQKMSKIKDGIHKYLVKEIDGKKMYLWSSDGQGNFRLYNDPPGNIGLLHYYGFVDKTDPVFKNTINYYYSAKYHYFFKDAKIQELACDHHPNTPSGLGLCGSILNPLKTEEALKWLKDANMDHGLLAESYDKNSGEGKTGVGFATGSGYLAFALHHVLISKEE
ncbi:glycoside hydrolase family 125 protein [Proteinivorax hydrogeniformans]|uniref:Glycoside hydrolase family 125 protein n=1 Tax=Proteinivorax hydrogeniformans TaxID=1826727 RepID=A0AAU8HQ61_9FIRM